MDCALSTSALFFLERAFVKTHKRIIEKFSAFRAEFAFGSVFFLAIILNHSVNGLLFSFDSWMLLNRRGQYVSSRWERALKFEINFSPNILGDS